MRSAHIGLANRRAQSLLTLRCHATGNSAINQYYDAKHCAVGEAASTALMPRLDRMYYRSIAQACGSHLPSRQMRNVGARAAAKSRTTGESEAVVSF